MIFNGDYDRALCLILIADRNNRYNIANLIRSMPEELIGRIKIRVNECEYSKKIEFSKAIRDDLGNISKFDIKISERNLRIKLSRWDQSNQNSEEVYDLDIGKINLEQVNEDDLTYVGSYYFSNSSLFMGIGPMIVDSDGVGYEIYINEEDKFVIQVSGNHVYDRTVDLKIIHDDIDLDDLYDRKSINRLVRGKRMR